MANIPWHECVTRVSPYVAKIVTPRGHGTGFLFAYPGGGGLCALATADHVVSDAAMWEEPVRIEQKSTGQSVLLRANERAIFRRAGHDTAAIVFTTISGLFPPTLLPLIPEEKAAKTGLEIGWLGFPGIAAENLCFFAGRVSSKLSSEMAYLVDGVAINGVSGGPAFSSTENSAHLMGIVSAYLPNVQSAGTLPGLCIVRHVGALHDIVRQLANLDQAKAEAETASSPSDATAAPPTPSDGAA